MSDNMLAAAYSPAYSLSIATISIDNENRKMTRCGCLFNQEESNRCIIHAGACCSWTLTRCLNCVLEKVRGPLTIRREDVPWHAWFYEEKGVKGGRWVSEKRGRKMRKRCQHPRVFPFIQ
jgi:hypothetical protein